MKENLAAQLRMRWIHPGGYLRGSGEEDPEAFGTEKPQHEVVLTHGFWLSDAPVTQALWMTVMGDNPSRFEGAARPVEQVSWRDTQQFCARLGQMWPGLHPRLPTEAEWEYAARAGTPTPRHGELDDIAWYLDNSGWQTPSVRQTHPVRQKQPNAWGLYDMLGNVWEWCQDCWDVREPYSGDVQLQADPLGTDGSKRVYRGGSWCSRAQFVRAAYRSAGGPGIQVRYLGFRLAGGRAPRSGARDGGAEAGGARRPGDGAPSGGSGSPGGGRAAAMDPEEPR